jgi:hypothetical protein
VPEKNALWDATVALVWLQTKFDPPLFQFVPVVLQAPEPAVIPAAVDVSQV